MVVDCNINEGVSSLRITTRNEDQMRPRRIIKPAANTEEGKWPVNQAPEKKETPPRVASKTQKRMMQCAKALRKMQQTLHQISNTKAAENKEVLKSVVVKAIERTFDSVASGAMSPERETSGQPELNEQPTDNLTEEPRQGNMSPDGPLTEAILQIV
ncbi:hypothetical protein K7X08_012879 [Anisodus acutangulus]|uniref:Uncharacterized protein n=1 Tax=Anisodus acutangulus TaxID=402998 RepID=A0A9Q1MEZ4_9SOLA|nr:hypothetical protein K7X08_012879 [Anisodus acutangulus]